MNKVYYLGPLLALTIFGGFYWNFSSHYEEKQRHEQAARDEALRQKAEVEQAARKKAFEEAIAEQERIKAERAARKAEEEARQKAREEALLARDEAQADRDKLSREVANLKKEISEAEQILTKNEQRLDAAKSEEAFLHDYVSLARENQKKLATSVGQIIDATKALTTPAK